MRLSIEMTTEQHQRLKAIAALRGQSMRDYVLARVLPDNTSADSAEALEDGEALRQLEAFLAPRIEQAERGETLARSVREIFAETLEEAR